jgi:hypothetical protein
MGITIAQLTDNHGQWIALSDGDDTHAMNVFRSKVTIGAGWLAS